MLYKSNLISIFNKDPYLKLINDHFMKIIFVFIKLLLIDKDINKI